MKLKCPNPTEAFIPLGSTQGRPGARLPDVGGGGRSDVGHAPLDVHRLAARPQREPRMRQGPRHTCHRRASQEQRAAGELRRGFGLRDPERRRGRHQGRGTSAFSEHALFGRTRRSAGVERPVLGVPRGTLRRHALSARLVGRPELQFGGAPKVPINIYGPGSDSGTYDFFAEATLCEDCFAGSLGRRFRAFSGLFRLFLSLFLFRSSGRTATTPKASRTAPRTSTAPWSSWPRSRTSPPSSRARGL